MKAYTDLEQSKKLAEILPIESADMAWCNNSIKGINYTDEYSANLYTVKEMKNAFDIALVGWNKYWKLIPCWSLAALLDLIPQRLFDDDGFSYYIRITKGMGLYYITYLCDDEERYHPVNVGCMNTLVDACYKIIVKLHERNIL